MSSLLTTFLGVSWISFQVLLSWCGPPAVVLSSFAVNKAKEQADSNVGTSEEATAITEWQLERFYNQVHKGCSLFLLYAQVDSYMCLEASLGFHVSCIDTFNVAFRFQPLFSGPFVQTIVEAFSRLLYSLMAARLSCCIVRCVLLFLDIFGWQQ